MKRTLHPANQEQLAYAVAEIMKHPLPLTVTFGPKRNKRSLDQNAISHVWYNQISKQLREDTPEGVKCECKLIFGVPILRAEDEKFQRMYDKSFKSILSHEEKLEAMEYLPVTRLMNTAQMSRYLEDIQMHYAKRSVRLEFA